MGSDKQRVALICAGLGLLTLAVFGRVTGYDFTNYDDPDYVANNLVVRAGLTWQGLQWAFAAEHASNWHPVTWLSHMLDCQLFGLQAGRHHLMNVLFHTANGLLLFGLLRRMTGAIWRSALVAALFLWHPAHVESVVWIAERKDVLSVFFGLLTLGAYFRYTVQAAAGRRSAAWHYGFALFFFAAALLSKAMLVGLPFLLCLLDFWPLRRLPCPGWPVGELEKPLAPGPARPPTWRWLLLEKLPFGVLLVISCVMTYLAQDHGGAVNSLGLVPLSLRLTNAVVAYARYVWEAFWPVNLAIFYPMPHGWPLGLVVAAGLFLLALTVLALTQARLRPWLLVGWFWFLETLGPVIGLVQVGTQSMADRYTYLPYVGLFLAAAWSLGELTERFPVARRTVPSATAMVLAMLLGLTVAQVRFWQTTSDLWAHALAVTQNNYEAYDNLGIEHMNAGRYAAALTNYQSALAIEPGFYMIHYHLGVLHALQKDSRAAEEEFQLALRDRPAWPPVEFRYGSLLAAQEQWAAAAEHYERGLQGAPDDAIAHQECGRVLARLGRMDAALTHLQLALRHNPDDAQARYDLALGLVMAGRKEDAITAYRAALARRPAWAVAQNDLAWLLATHPQATPEMGAEAVRLAEQAVRLEPKQTSYLGTLDAAYAAAGRFPEAVATAEKVRDLATAVGQKDIAEAANRRLAAYRTGQAYREP